MTVSAINNNIAGDSSLTLGMTWSFWGLYGAEAQSKAKGRRNEESPIEWQNKLELMI